MPRKFILELGDNGYHKLGEFVVCESTLKMIEATVTRLPVLAMWSASQPVTVPREPDKPRIP